MSDATVADATVSDADARKKLTASGVTLRWWAERIGDKSAIVSDFGTRTFAELEARANQLGRALRRRGLKAGDAIALVCTNRPEFAEVVAAYQRTGLRMTPINWHLTGDEAAYIVADCEAKAIVADTRLAGTALGAVAKAPGVTVKLAVGGDIDGFDAYEEALAAEDSSYIDAPVLGASMLYTSGTTGRPKGVYRPPGSTPSVNIYGYSEAGDDLHLCTGPLYHAAPLSFSLNAPLTYGAGVVLMDKWDPEEALRLIAEHRITHTHMVPTMFHRLLSLPEDVRAKYDLSSLRYVLHGAAPCPVPIKQRLIEWLGPIVWEYYAATEGVGSFVDSKTWLERPGTVGKPADPKTVKIGDDDGNELPRGEIGLVYIKPATAPFQYFKDQTKTASSFRGEYFTLGDVGYMDDDGYVYLTDRTANLIISGGVNIYPAEVDAVLLQHPAVGDAATIGVPNDEWGEEVKAVVELQPEVEATPGLAEELLAFCRERLAHYKCPRTLDFIDELPRQDNGKIYKRLLRDRYRAAAS
ncbi:MAG TPA: AMP-binding protein [Acidimicrobiales bacterium]